MKLRILVAAGARPNFVKIAPIVWAARSAAHHVIVANTGQHYDHLMARAFFSDLRIPAPDYDLGVGSGTHAQQTARVLEAFEPVLLEARPDWVVVVGDVNSTLACALAAVKLKEQLGCRIAHVEAGLRSGDWRMPEEVNRVLTDRVADLLFAPSRDAIQNLRAEGIPAERIAFVGNVMIDTLFQQLPCAQSMNLPARLGFEPGSYVVATIHRPSNVDSAPALREILEGLASINRTSAVVLPLHPRTRKAVEALGLAELLEKLHVLEPMNYTEMLALTKDAAVIVTDSGGLQEEATVLGVPCLTLREHTERPVTVAHGTNRLVQWPFTAARIEAGFQDALAMGRCAVGERCPEKWDGRTAARIVRYMTATALLPVSVEAMEG